jgi:hypothetical protein
MNSFQVVPIPTEVAEGVRATGKAPVYGFPAHRELAGVVRHAVIVCA